MTADEFTDAILDLRGTFSFSITSWIRSEARNKKVGGAARSHHLDGTAVDLVLDDKTQAPALIAAAAALGINAIDEKDHLHLQPL